MTAPASHTRQNPENLEARGDQDVRLLPKPGDDTSAQDSILMAFDPKAHEVLKDVGFAARLEHTFGVRAETSVHVPLTWIDDGKILTPEDPGFFEKTDAMRDGPNELGGYFGINLSREGFSSASDHVAAGIAALISDIYQEDEQLRVLHNYTLEEPSDPIEITGPNYNLAETATQEHPTIDLREIVGHPVSLQHMEPAPNLFRASFA